MEKEESYADNIAVRFEVESKMDMYRKQILTERNQISVLKSFIDGLRNKKNSFLLIPFNQFEICFDVHTTKAMIRDICRELTEETRDINQHIEYLDNTMVPYEKYDITEPGVYIAWS